MLFITEEEGNAFHVHRISDCNHLSQMLCLPRETDTECKPSPLLLTHTEPVAMGCFKPLSPPKTPLCRPPSLPYYSKPFPLENWIFFPNKLQHENETTVRRFPDKSTRVVCDESFPVPLTPSVLPLLERLCSTQTAGPLLQSASVTRERW